MSQWGACYYAEAGYTYDQILTHYYVNCYLGLSAVNDKAVKRGQMSQDEIDKEIKDSEIVDEGGNAFRRQQRGPVSLHRLSRPRTALLPPLLLQKHLILQQLRLTISLRIISP